MTHQLKREYTDYFKFMSFYQTLSVHILAMYNVEYLNNKLSGVPRLLSVVNLPTVASITSHNSLNYFFI